ncbi:MAG: hypothetical protein ACSHXY_02015 [Alphaproteobacteria bacterium]
MANNNGKSNGMYILIGALVVVVLGLGYMVATGQFADEPDLSIEVSEDGLDIDTD